MKRRIKIQYVCPLNPFASKSVFGNASQSSFIQKDLALLRTYFDVSVVSRRNLKGTLMAPFKMIKNDLNHLEEWTDKRRANARFYSKALDDITDDKLETPQIAKGRKHIFNQYTIRVKNGKRDKLKEFLEGQGISTAIYYPLALHLQPCFSFLGYKKEDFLSAEKASEEFLSLPIYPELKKEEREYVVEKVLEFFKR